MVSCLERMCPRSSSTPASTGISWPSARRPPPAPAKAPRSAQVFPVLHFRSLKVGALDERCHPEAHCVGRGICFCFFGVPHHSSLKVRFFLRIRVPPPFAFL